MDLNEASAKFAADVGHDGPVTVQGLGTRGGGVDGVRSVTAPSGIIRIEPDEMIVECHAGTPVDEVQAALAEHGQRVTLPSGGTVGGALAVGLSGTRRLGDGHLRDALLQAHYVSSTGALVTAGGPTVKNVSGFDLCRLLVGSRGTLGFLADVILRTQPIAELSSWFVSSTDPQQLQRDLYRPVSLLWDGNQVWALLEGNPDDVAAQAEQHHLEPSDPPSIPTGGRWSIAPSEVDSLTGEFVAELGVGVVHRPEPAPPRALDSAVVALHARIKANFDPTGRLNPGVDVTS